LSFSRWSTSNCTHTLDIVGNLTITLEDFGEGTLGGELDVDWNKTEASRTCSGALGASHDTLTKPAISGPPRTSSFVTRSAATDRAPTA
jgi:hypothetical protein